MPEIGSLGPPSVSLNAAKPLLVKADNPAQLPQLAPGQALSAKVVQVSNPANGSAHYQLIVEAGTQRISLQAARAVAPGSLLILTRDSAGDLQARLADPRQSAVDQALRQHLPRQAPLSELFSLLANTLTKPTTSGLAPLIQAMLALRLDARGQPSGERLKRGIERSGVFFESRIAGSRSVPTDDLKGLLLAARQQLGNDPAEPQLAKLSTSIDQSLSRIALNQLKSLLNSDGEVDLKAEQGRNITVELPLQIFGKERSLQLTIRKEPPPSTSRDPQVAQWCLQLNFDLEAGPLEVELRLQDRLLQTRCYCKEPVKQLLEPELGRLTSALQRTGLEVAAPEVKIQRRPSNQPAALSGRPLIDIHT